MRPLTVVIYRVLTIDERRQGEWRGDEVEETEWLTKVAESNAEGHPHGIVAYADLSQPTAAHVLASHAKVSSVCEPLYIEVKLL